MEPRERVLAALDHKEADRVPRDFAGTRYTSIHVEAYKRLRPALGLPEAEMRIIDTTQGLAHIHDDILERLGADVALVSAGSPSTYTREVTDDGEYERFLDEFGVLRARPQGGLYYESTTSPLSGDISAADVDAYPWPDPTDPGRFKGMKERVAHIRDVEKRAVFVGSLCAGVTEMHFRMRGYEDGYMDMALNPDLARKLMRTITDLKLAYWEKVLDEIGPDMDIAAEADDLGAQHAPLFSPQAYRDIVKPLHKEIIDLIKSRSNAKFFLHSCGAIKDLIPDLIDIGVDALNPVQVSAEGMETAGLKAEFGKDITFWGGTLDPQKTLARGTPEEVKAETIRRILDLKPGGGFVFASIHNMQAHLPVENMLAFWEAVEEVGDYD
ncbi:MAG: uroporphyrinogen decarboxylase family protein [Chloroflexota bacterium]|nr:uroporphyrinogen decarboxylase family protein [Chloroflexota bacterium]